MKIINTIQFQVKKNSGRLDKAVAQKMPDLSRSRIKNLILENYITVNGENQKPKYLVKVNDDIKINIPEPQTIDLVPEKMALDIVYEDDDVLVVNKPQGMVVHPSAGHPDHTLVNGLLYHTPLSNINGTYRPGIVHRIDKDTSGLLMVAKNNLAHQSLSKQLKDKTNVRAYLALVEGNIRNDQGSIDAPIGRSPKDRKKQAIVSNGRKAITHFKVLERFNNYTLIKCQLETGRTHQIRVHMKYINHPIVGDPLYGHRRTIKGNGQFLHAYELGFKHPRTKKELTFTAPLPEVFEKLIKSLQQKRQTGRK